MLQLQKRRGLLTGALLTFLLILSSSSSATAPAGRFTVAGAVVTDTQSGLKWQQTHDTALRDFGVAAAYCASLNLGGTGWRVPGVKELLTIVDDTAQKPAIDATAFPNTSVGNFWTSSKNAMTGDGYYVDFSWGDSSTSATSAKYYVRCVR